MSIGFLIVLSLALGLAAWLFFMWTVRSGQYDDPEGPKYRMLDDDEGEAPPRSETRRAAGHAPDEHPGHGPSGRSDRRST